MPETRSTLHPIARLFLSWHLRSMPEEDRPYLAMAHQELLLLSPKEQIDGAWDMLQNTLEYHRDLHNVSPVLAITTEAYIQYAVWLYQMDCKLERQHQRVQSAAALLLALLVFWASYHMMCFAWQFFGLPQYLLTPSALPSALPVLAFHFEGFTLLVMVLLFNLHTLKYSGHRPFLFVCLDQQIQGLGKLLRGLKLPGFLNPKPNTFFDWFGNALWWMGDFLTQEALKFFTLKQQDSVMDRIKTLCKKN